MVNLDSKRSVKEILDRELGDNYIAIYINENGECHHALGDNDTGMTCAYYVKMMDAICDYVIAKEMEG